MIDGVSYVRPRRRQIADVVDQFTNPTQAPVTTKGAKIGKKMFPVRVYNGSGIAGLATTAGVPAERAGLQRGGRRRRLRVPGQGHGGVRAQGASRRRPTPSAQMLSPADVRIVERAPGTSDGISVFVASSFDGTIEVPEEVVQEQQTLEKNQKVDWATWQEYDKKTPLKLEAPTAWSSGFTYDEWRNYSIETTDGKRSAASVAVVQTSQYGYWSIQAMRWQDPPAIENPNGTQTIGGRDVHALLPGRPPAHGGLEGARDALLGAQHPRQPALERSDAGSGGVV